MSDTPGDTSRTRCSRRLADGQPVTGEALEQLPPFVAIVVSDYARGGEQRWTLRECSFDLDSLDNLPCAKGSTIEIWLPGATYWLRRDCRGGISLCPVHPLAKEGEPAAPGEHIWVVEQTASRDAHIIVWQVAVESTEQRGYSDARHKSE